MTTTSQPTMDERLAGQAGVPPVAPPPARRLPGGRRRLPGPGVGQLVVAELVLFAVLAAVGRAPWLLAVVGVLAAATIAVLFARRRNRWWYEYGLLRVSFRRWTRRTREAAGPPPTPAGPAVDQRRAGLRELAPDLAVDEVTERAGTFGLAHDATGWFAVVEVITTPAPNPPAQGPRPDGAGPVVPLRALAELVDGSAQLSRVQLVMHAAAAPVARLTAWSPAAASYRDVAARLAGPVPPSESRTWLAVRLDAADAVLAAETRGGGATGVRRALSTALGRVGRVLSGAGLEYRMLDADGLLDALALSLGLAAQPGMPPMPAPTGPARTGPAPAGHARTEHRWDRLVVDGYGQVCFEVTGWPPHGGRLTAALAGLPAAWTTLSLVLGPHSDLTAPGEVPLHGALRVAAAPDAIGPACEALDQAAYTQAVGLRRMDGEQGPAAYATAPTGGGA
jgi:type VII secretion protein EccE